MKILNLYCGIGGNRHLWGDEHSITAVELNNKIADKYAELYTNDKIIVGGFGTRIINLLKTKI